MLTHACAFFITVFSLVSPAVAADVVAPNANPLFASYQELPVTLEAPFKDLFKHQNDGLFEAKKTHVAGRILAGNKTISVDIRMRGWTSLQGCSFPKLMLKLNQVEAAGTIFESVKKLDVGTHCVEESETDRMFYFARFPQRESLFYRWADLLGIATLATRPASITYHDTSATDPIEDRTRPAFLVEHLSSFLKRAKGVEIRVAGDMLHPDAESSDKVKAIWTGPDSAPTLDRDQLARVALFQSIIGNGDWRLNLTEIWNTKIVELPSGTWLAVPMDLNFAMAAAGQSVRPSLNNEFWTSAPDDLQKRIAAEFLEKLPALTDTLALLGADAAGKKSLSETLANTRDVLEKVASPAK